MTAAGLAANLGGVALFALPGIGLAELFAPLARLPWWRRLGYALLLGVVALAGSLFAASHLWGVPLRRPAIATAAAVPAVLGVAARAWAAWRRRRARGARDAATAPASPADRFAPATHSALPAGTSAPARPAPSVRRPWRFAAAAVVVAVCLGTLASALSVPLADWDGRMTWSALAAYLRQEGTVDLAVLREARWFVVHPRYPPLLPLAQEMVQETFGAGLDEQLYRALYVAFLAALLLVIRDGAGRAAGAAAATLTVLCAALPHFFSYGSGGAASAYSDLPLAGFYGAGLVLLLLAPRRPSSGLAAGCLLAGAVLSKNEGAPLAACALLLAATRLLDGHRARQARRRRLAPRRLAWLAAAALPVLAAAALLAAWRAAIPNRFDEDYFAAARLPALAVAAVMRLPEIVQQALRLSFRWSDWQGFWVLFLVVLLAGLPALRRPAAGRMLLAGLAPAGLAWAAYAVTTPRDNLAPFVSETWPRFLLQGMVPLAIVFACALRHVLRQLRLETRLLQPAARTQPAPAPTVLPAPTALPATPPRQPGGWESQVRIAEDFDAPLPAEIQDAFEGRR
jgi:hypothetical protein